MDNSYRRSKNERNKKKQEHNNNETWPLMRNAKNVADDAFWALLRNLHIRWCRTHYGRLRHKWLVWDFRWDSEDWVPTLWLRRRASHQPLQWTILTTVDQLCVNQRTGHACLDWRLKEKSQPIILREMELKLPAYHFLFFPPGSESFISRFAG